MQHRILTESASFYRRVARNELKGNWMGAAVASLIFYVILGIIEFIVSLFGANSATELISGVYFWIIYGPITVGIVAFFMNLVRNKEHKISDCFEGFESFGRSFVLGLLMILFISLWALLFIVPGIIAVYRYSMAPMILRDRPDLSPIECISESKRIMIGNKGSKFCLDFSFIGWALLAMVPEIVLTAVIESNSMFANPLGVVIVAICYIPMIWVFAYMQTANVVFYEELIRPIYQNQYNGGQFCGNSNYGQYSYQRYERPEDGNND